MTPTVPVLVAHTDYHVNYARSRLFPVLRHHSFMSVLKICTLNLVELDLNYRSGRFLTELSRILWPVWSSENGCPKGVHKPT